VLASKVSRELKRLRDTSEFQDTTANTFVIKEEFKIADSPAKKAKSVYNNRQKQEWLLKLTVPKVRPANRVRTQSGTEWIPSGNPELKLVYEAGKKEPVLHWTFPKIIRTNTHADEQCKELNPGDCIVVNACDGDLPYIGMISDLWSDNSYNKNDIKITVYWYYRATDIEEVSPDIKTSCPHFICDKHAIYASKHRDVISAASVDNTCFVLTQAEYSWYLKRCKLLAGKLVTHAQVGENDPNDDILDPVLHDGTDEISRKKLPRPRRGGANDHNVFFCPGVYDVHKKKISGRVSESY